MIRDGLRYLALAAVAGVSSLLGGRAVAGLSGRTDCQSVPESLDGLAIRPTSNPPDACFGCGELAWCRLPQAVQARRARAR